MYLSLSCPCCKSTNLKKSYAIFMPFIAKMAFGYDLEEIDDSWNLHSIENGKLYFPNKSVQCQNCGHLFSDLRFDFSETKNLYSNYRESRYVEIRDFFEPGYKEKQIKLDEVIGYKKDIENFLSCVIERPLVLDWGGDDGKNTPFLNTAKSIHIYEFSDKKLLNNCKKVELDEVYKNNYDLVVCSNVLEHVSEPIDLLKQITKCMNNNTVLYIEVPYENIMQKNEGSLDLYNLKKHWHEHINFYSEQSLRLLTNLCGLEVIKYQKFSYHNATDYAHFENFYMLACKLKSEQL